MAVRRSRRGTVPVCTGPMRAGPMRAGPMRAGPMRAAVVRAAVVCAALVLAGCGSGGHASPGTGTGTGSTPDRASSPVVASVAPSPTPFTPIQAQAEFTSVFRERKALLRRLATLAASKSRVVANYRSVCTAIINSTDTIEGRLFADGGRWPVRTATLLGTLETKLDAESETLQLCQVARTTGEVATSFEWWLKGDHGMPPTNAEPTLTLVAHSLGLN